MKSVKQVQSFTKQAQPLMKRVQPLTKPILILMALSLVVGTPRVLANSPSGLPNSGSAPTSTHSGLPNGGSVHAPIRASGVMALDLPDSSARSIILDIQEGRFSDYSAGHLTLTGTGIDFRNGSLQSLKADIMNGNFDNFWVDRLNILTPAFTFDTMQLLNNRVFALSQPVTAKVTLTLSETGLNRFLSAPSTLEKIEKGLRKQTGGLKLITLSNPSLLLQGNGRVKVAVTGIVAQGLAVPLEMTGKLDVQSGQLVMTGLSLTSGANALQLPIDLAGTFQNKINELIDVRRLGKNTLSITADKLKQTGKTLQLDGHATLTRLQFG